MHAHPLELIETKIAFLEHANAELSDVVSRQQREIATLREQLATLAARMRAARDSEMTTPTAEDERPPHY